MTACLGRQLADLADGRLVGPARERALAHVAACASCRDALEVQRSVRGLLGAAAVPDPSGDFLARLRAGVPMREAADSLALSRTPGGQSTRRRRRAVTAGVSALVTTVAVAGLATSVAQTAAAPPPPSVVPQLSAYAADHASAAGALPIGGPGLAGGQAAPPVVRVSHASRDLPPVPTRR